VRRKEYYKANAPKILAREKAKKEERKEIMEGLIQFKKMHFEVLEKLGFAVGQIKV
jgi:hypothetical protein